MNSEKQSTNLQMTLREVNRVGEVKKNIPKLRFKGYEDAWEQRKLGSAINVRSGKDYKHLEKGDVPVYGTGGYMLSVSEALENTQDAIGIGRKGTIDKPFVLKAPFWTVDTLFYCIPKGNNSLGFLYPLFQSINWKLYDESTGVPSLSKTAIEGVAINLTSKDEQYSIGEYFESVDNLITLHQRKYDALKSMKKTLLSKMFPKNGEDVPEIRFKEFTDAWEQRKLESEIKDFIVPMRDKPKEFGGDIPWTRIEDIEGKYLNDTLSNQYVTEETVHLMNLNIIPKDSLIVSSSATFGVVAIVTRDLVTNQTFIGLVPNDKNTLEFWYSFFHSAEARKYMRLESVGSTIFYIAREKFEKMPVKVPKIKEMMVIGEYFNKLDQLITLHQRKLDELKNMKKTLLQQMFV